MSNEEIVRAWKDPEADRFAAGHPLGDPDLTAITGGLAPVTVDDICDTQQTGCGSCGSASFGCC